MTNEITLRVAEALQKDVGRGIARIDVINAKKLAVSSGDIIEVHGEKTTAVIVWLGYPEDEGLDIIRVDGLTRQNSGSSLGDKVRVRKARVYDAKNIVIAPTKHEIQLGGDFANHLKRRLLGRPLIKGDNFSIGTLGGQAIPFMVSSTKPAGIIQITEVTDLEVRSKPVTVESAVPTVRYEDIGGLKDEISKVREMIELPMKHPELFEKVGIAPPKGVLLYGPPGTGKTLLAKAVASETNAHFILINGPEIIDKYYGQSEENLRNIFQEAQKNAPSIIFIDEIDSIAPKREETKGEVERRVVAQLLALMDGLVARGNVVVIAATNRQDALDPALRRPGRFDREIEIGVPDRVGRREVLQIHTRAMPIEKDKKENILDEMASVTHGYVGADLEALAREAAMIALKRILPEIDLETEEIPAQVLESLSVKREDFIEALKGIEPSALREVLIEIPNLTWKDIGDLKEVKQKLIEAIEWPLKYPDAFKKMGIRTPKGILLYGPPGCGKTLLAKAAANESEANFISIKGPAVLSKWVGESEKKIREIFKKARQTAPTIVFFDELDAIAPRRGVYTGSHVTETVLNQILTEIDGVEPLENVIVIGATNRADMLDPGLLRPGRFDFLIFVPAPDKEARLKIFKVHTNDMPLKDVDLDELAKKTTGYTGADIEGLCREAGMVSLREDIKGDFITQEHFNNALKKVKPSLSRDDVEGYKKISKDEVLTPACG